MWQERSEFARERRIALYKKVINNSNIGQGAGIAQWLEHRTRD